MRGVFNLVLNVILDLSLNRKNQIFVKLSTLNSFDFFHVLCTFIVQFLVCFQNFLLSLTFYNEINIGMYITFVLSEYTSIIW